jgi:DNA-binding NtrC family response regulator
VALRPGPYREQSAGGGSGLPSARLIRLHRHSLTNVLVVGGTAERRDQVARAFHQESPLRTGPFVHVDCRREEERLRVALEDWTAAPTDLIGTPMNPYRDAEQGTLYLDPVEQLSPDTQRLLLALARRLHGEPAGNNDAPCAGRLVSGNPRGLGEAVSEGRFMAALYDALDKVRVELEAGTPETSA